MIYTDYEFLEEIMKNKYKLLCIGFALAGCCYIAGTINHILNTGESVLSSVLLAAGCFCLAFAYYKEAKKRSTDKKQTYVMNGSMSSEEVYMNCFTNGGD